MWNPCGWNPCGIRVESVWNQCGIPVEYPCGISMWNPCGIRVELLVAVYIIHSPHDLFYI
eukprot:1342220-Amorphochlora_amoeboformis.AAC.1